VISTSNLAQFCRRAATSLHAGLDVRQVFQREATIGPHSQRQRMTGVMERIDAGQAVADAMTAEQGYFPGLATEMIRVGEQTGKLERVLAQLAEHYEQLLRLRRTFLLGILWPAIELAFALAIVGFLIWIMGVIDIRNLHNEPVDVIGLGLKGTSGLFFYLLIVGTLVAALATLVVALSRGWLWTGPMMPVLIKVPIVGRCLTYLALSRFSWTLGMAIDAGMEATRSLKLALGAAQNTYYSTLWPQVQRTMQRRCPMHDALRETGRFPEEFLIVLETGETSGMVTETLEHQANEYRDRAQGLLRMLTTFAGVACFGLVAVIIIALIFKLAGYYLGLINEAASF
jgi:type II secretory pathway component PulF